MAVLRLPRSSRLLHPPRSLRALHSLRSPAVFGGLLAAVLAGVSMLLLRSTMQVRSIPERIMEWLLLFVPPGVFEAGIQQLGFDAKRYALYLAIVVMLGLLAWLGHAVMRRRLPVGWIGLLGVLLWLAVMLIIMPVTSAGVFAFDLFDGRRAAIGGYLAVGLTYAAVLALVQTWPRPYASVTTSRRAALRLTGLAAISFFATYIAVRLLPHQATVPAVLLEDPQEPIPSGGIDPPGPHPNLVQAPGEPAVEPASASATAVPGLPEPSATRAFTRDKDGAVVTGGHALGQLTPPITSNADFYIVTKNAGGDPILNPSDWRIVIDGEVAQSFQLDYPTLRKLPSVEVTKTLECISNFVGKPELAPFGAELMSTAVWRGVPVRDIMRLVGGPKPEAAWVLVFAADEFTSTLPLEVVMDPATLLVYEMNGEVLPHEHGYPARLLVPDRYGMKNAKWLTGLRVVRRELNDWYGQRNWSKTAVVRTMSRIDVPAPGAVLAPGQHTVAGIAYAGRRGIQRVDFSVDEGRTWHIARLSEATAGQDRWVAWQGTFDLPPRGTASVIARATDGTGALQVEGFSLPEPDGGTGWPRIAVRANQAGG